MHQTTGRKSQPITVLGVRSLARLARFTLVLFIVVLPALSQSIPRQTFGALQWRFIGPYRGGRVVAVTGIPGDSRAAYFGAVDGGIWKSPNAGITWEPIFDGQSAASIGALAIAPSDPNIMYTGTGESDIRSDLSSGDGVYKSTDGGKSWTNIGLGDSRQISRIVIDPRNPDVVFVAALGHAYGPNEERGVFKSTDGGKTWSKVLYKGPEIGASDLAMASANAKVLFAGMWRAVRPPWSTYAPVEGPGSGLYRSTDSGATWTELTGHGLPDGQWGRVGVTVAPDGKRVYALIDAGKKSGLYRSDDGGDNWVLANADPRLTSRAWYFNWPSIDPSNPDVVYIPNIALYRSEDAGKTISIVRGAPGGDDYHAIWVDPKNSDHLILGVDQGTTISLDRGKTWSPWYNQPTAQMYHVTTDNQFPYNVYGAQQDIGSIAIPSRTDHGQITPRDPFLIGGGESGYTVIDPSDPNVLYATGVYGSAIRFDRRTSLSQNISPWPAENFGTEISGRKYRDTWTPMLTQSPAEKGVLYMGTQYVLRSSDGGLHWTQISPDLTGAAEAPAAKTAAGAPTMQDAKDRGYGVVFSIAPSPLDARLIWAGSDTGLLHLTRDGGKRWQNVTPPGLSTWSKFSMIEASHFDPAVAYVAVDRHRLDDNTPHVFRTRDYGKTWQPITNGIPANTFLRAIRQDTQKQNLLFAGTELGIYVSFDEGDHWQPLQLNLPATSVRDLDVHGDDLAIATHGRGFWILDNITPLRQISDQTARQPAVLFAPATVVRVDNDGFLGTPLPPEVPTAKNPPDGAMIDYYLKDGAREVTLDIYDQNNKLVRHITSGEKPPSYPPLPIAERWLPTPSLLETTAGMHRYVWDLRWGGNESEAGGEEDYRAPHPPRIAPGTYSVKLTVDGESYSQPLKVTMDPRSSATPAILQQQQQLALQIYSEAQEARSALREVESVSKKLAALKPEVQAKQPGLLSQLIAVQSAVKEIRSGNPSSPGTISGLSAASSGLASALRVVESGDRTTPAQALEVYHLSAEAANNSLAEWKKLQSGALAQLDRSLQAKGLGPSHMR